MGHCAKCGRELNPQARFCPGCGAVVEQVPASPAITRPAAGPPKGPGGKLFGFSRWDFSALVGGVISAGVWHYWSTIDKYAPQDGFTQLYILAFTAAVIFLRAPLDALLAPVHALKRHIPRLVLIGVALALPYFLAHYFYKQGVSNYPLMHKSIVWGTILPYMLLRIPAADGRGGGMPRAASLVHVWLPALVLGCVMSAPSLVLADDFSNDFTRLEDGLRTPGWAETIAGTAATTINVLVNGALVFQTSGLTPQVASTVLDNPSARTQNAVFSLDIRSQDSRLSMKADDEDSILFYARVVCDKPVPGTFRAAETAGITLQATGPDSDWLQPDVAALSGGYMRMKLKAKPPTLEKWKYEDPIDARLTVSATMEGQPVKHEIKLEVEGPALEVSLEAQPDAVCANGQDELALAPRLRLFGKRFEGGLRFRNQTPGSSYLPYEDPFFKETDSQIAGVTSNDIEVWHGTRLEVVSFPLSSGYEVLKMRCKFRLEAERIVASLPQQGHTRDRVVALPPLPGQPAAMSPRMDLRVYFADNDKLAATFPDGIKPDDPAAITLRPSRIELKADPPQLPKPVTDPSRLFTARISARVLDGNGKPVPGTCIPDAQTIASVAPWLVQHGWRMKLSYRPAQAGYQEVEIDACDVNSDGEILTSDARHYQVPKAQGAAPALNYKSLPSPQSFYEYDHEKWCWDGWLYRLKVQQSLQAGSARPVLHADYLVDGESHGQATISIGHQVRSVLWSWDYSMFFLSDGTYVHEKAMEEDKSDSSYDWLKDNVLNPHTYHCIQHYRLTPENNLTELPRILPLHTIVVKPGHHGIVIQSSASGVIIGHYLQRGHKAPGQAQSGWINRDQIRDGEAAAEARLGGASPPVGVRDQSEAMVYFDDLDTFFARGSGLRDYNIIDVWYPSAPDFAVA